MTDRQNPQTSQNLPSSSSSSSSSSKLTPETSKANSSSSGQKIRYPNPAETSIPDAATLREQWKFAIKQYSKWYSHAWGTAILAGLSFFALGWVIKGSNPLPSFKGDDSPAPSDDPDNSK
ncbi:uncharacterized protein LOC116142857 [Pistacia vera]|uniref:uncharacterized protein LOC116142857 n=1 Tax=Pistacia vera TaxID=55513 RepID=UPI001263B0B9|nr:uncharacterized protein LOC116142857 [Pistacia vera]